MTPKPVNLNGFNPKAKLPFRLEVHHVQQAMESFVEFLDLINRTLAQGGLPPIELLLMPATFSSIVGEFIKLKIPAFCPHLVVNQYHNGYPDLIPKGRFPGNAVQHTDEGVEIKASRYERGWQGHNPEDVWLMVFVFASGRPGDTSPQPFHFRAVYCARLQKTDWKFSGRKSGSRRTITASVTGEGLRKLRENWVYRDRDP